MSIIDEQRAEAASFPATDIQVGDFITLAGSCLRVTAAVHRGGITRLELGLSVRVQIHSHIDVTVIRPVRPARPVRPVRALWAR
ncbi:hypothetical protein [Streptomyces otsuchiensis]|uniref:hypothetical protein n=1 Tax=Streptomyces otsuchiensis TaxID=2681388 RepID=UPI0010300282|nr:hypothetical protein [Streptomyces otsuchiensis]